MRVPFPTGKLVDSTQEGIGTLAPTDTDVVEPTAEDAEDSEIDENHDIMDLEKRDFNDGNGIEEDMDGAN